jgi:hypothetical protein
VSDEDPGGSSRKETIDELDRRLQELKDLHRASRFRWDRPATIVGVGSALAGAGWTVLASFDLIGGGLTALGLATLAYDQLYRVPRDERRARERRRQVDLVISTAGTLLELMRRSRSK